MAQERTPFGLRMPDNVKEWVKRKAEREGRSANNLIVQVLRAAMEEEATQGA